jgi:hypothetical protein
MTVTPERIAPPPRAQWLALRRNTAKPEMHHDD